MKKLKLAILAVLAGVASSAFAAYSSGSFPLEVNVSARAEGRFDDNLLLQDANRINDWVGVFAPGVELKLGKEASNLVIKAEEQFVQYSTNKVLDDNYTKASFHGVAQHSHFKLTTHGKYVEELQNDITLPGLLVERTVSQLGAKADIPIGEKFAGSAGLSYEKSNYEIPFLFDRHTYTLPADVYYSVNEHVAIGAGYEYRETKLYLPTNLSAYVKDDLYYAGARGQFGKVTGDIKLGFGERDFDLPAPAVLPSQDLFAVRADFGYQHGKTLFDLKLSHDFGLGTASDPYKAKAAHLGASRKFGEKLSARAHVGYRDLDYDLWTDKYYEAGLEADYRLHKHLDLFAGVLARKLRSDNPLSDAKNTVASFGILAHF